jgi:two-component system CheB/CheR fusion protein
LIRRNLVAEESVEFPTANPSHQMLQDHYLKSMAVMHARLYESRDLTEIDFSSYLDQMMGWIFPLLVSGRKDISLRIDADGVYMNIDSAMLCGALICELVGNSLRHAFPNGRGGEVKLELSKDDSGKYRLMVRDNGVGIPGAILSGNERALGLNLITLLVHQLQGTMDIECNGGTAFYIAFTGPEF